MTGGMAPSNSMKKKLVLTAAVIAALSVVSCNGKKTNSQEMCIRDSDTSAEGEQEPKDGSSDVSTEGERSEEHTSELQSHSEIYCPLKLCA